MPASTGEDGRGERSGADAEALEHVVRVGVRFNATHRVPLPDGSLEPLHGHDWRVEIEVGAERLTPAGFVADFHRLREHLEHAVAVFEHRCLNDLPMFAERPPSAENVARYLFDALSPGLAALGVVLRALWVEEAPGCLAGVRRREGAGAAQGGAS